MYALSLFDNAPKEEWKEGEDRVVDTVDTDTASFRIWVKWLYRNG
jgi:hypothetical protein